MHEKRKPSSRDFFLKASFLKASPPSLPGTNKRLGKPESPETDASRVADAAHRQAHRGDWKTALAMGLGGIGALLGMARGAAAAAAGPPVAHEVMTDAATEIASIDLVLRTETVEIRCSGIGEEGQAACHAAARAALAGETDDQGGAVSLEEKNEGAELEVWLSFAGAGVTAACAVVSAVAVAMINARSAANMAKKSEKSAPDPVQMQVTILCSGRRTQMVADDDTVMLAVGDRLLADLTKSKGKTDDPQ